jgi:hypothetical protein
VTDRTWPVHTLSAHNFFHSTNIQPLTASHWDLELYSSSNHISPLLNRPQGWQGCQKNQKDLRITTMIRFCASFQPKLNELHKKLQNQQKSSKYAGFLVIFQTFFNFGWKLALKRIMVVILRSFWFFWHPWHPWGRLSSGDILVLRFVLNNCYSGAAWRIFYIFIKMISHVSFII